MLIIFRLSRGSSGIVLHLWVVQRRGWDEAVEYQLRVWLGKVVFWALGI